jgi:hypothetical protein
MAITGPGRADCERDGGLSESASLALHDLRRQLQRRADGVIADALLIALDLLAGYRRAEIQARFALDDARYREAHRWLRDAQLALIGGA